MPLSNQRLTKAITLPRAISITLTIGLLWLGISAPPKRLTLFPTQHAVVNGFSDAHNNSAGKSNYQWIHGEGEESIELRCELRTGAKYPNCGASLKFYKNPQHSRTGRDPDNFKQLAGHDLTQYEGLELQVRYLGSANKMQVTARNVIQNSPNKDQFFLGKLQMTSIHPEEFDRTVIINFNEFNTVDWWIHRNNIHRKKSMPEFFNIMEISFSFPHQTKNGIHDIEVTNISAIGQWLSHESMYLAIIVVWLTYILTEFVHWAWRARSRIAIAEHSLIEIQQDANNDPLTNILNRRGIHAAINNHLKQKPQLSLIIFDIDHFKNINDQYGHNSGDQILIQIATLVQQSIRKDDYFGRWGGEEFILLGHDIHPDQIHTLAEKIRLSIANTVFYFGDDATGVIRITVSCGWTQKIANETFEVTLERADKALYIAKNNGRNMTVAF